MKKLYATLFAAVAIGMSTSAQSLTAVRSDAAAQLVPDTETSTGIAKLTSKHDAIKADSRHKAQTKKAVPVGEWKNLGKGTWVDAFIEDLTGKDIGSWQVDVYESATVAGYYRVAPYVEGSNAATLIGKADPNAIIYINATDPTKVYVDGDFNVYGYTFSHCTPENEWDEASYGNLANGVISFPAQSFAVYDDGWYIANANGKLKLFLPGATVTDYTFKASATFCPNEEGKVPVTISRGTDVATVKYLATDGYFNSNETNNNLVKSKGTEFPTQYNTLSIPATIMTEGDNFTVLFVALDAAGNIVNSGEVHTVCPRTVNADDWTMIGKGTFSEGLLSSVFSDVPAEDMSVNIYQNNAQQGIYRIDNAYAGHSILAGKTLNHTSHVHSIYINATDPEKVFVEPSHAGISIGSYGDVAIWSKAPRYVAAGAPEAQTAPLYGKLADNKITMPDGSMYVALANNDGGKYRTAGENFAITLPDPSGISSITADNSSAEAEYYNLQGIRIDAPAAGTVCIRRTGSKVEKIVVR